MVRSSDGRSCADDCEWITAAPLTLTAEEGTHARFAGFSGACSGTICELTSGEVVATFVDDVELRIVVSGSGAGIVRAADRSWECTTSCSIWREPSRATELIAEPDAETLPPTLGGACSENPCSVLAPATVSVIFERGRRVNVSFAGSGEGAVEVPGIGRCTSDCSHIVPTGARIVLNATPLDDLNSFRGFGGDCADVPEMCTIEPGSNALTVTATFDSVLLWSRSFPVFGSTQALALHADESGIAISASTTGGIEVDGNRYQSAQQVNAWSTFIELGWDGGVHWSVPIPGLGAAASDTMTSIARLGSGAIVAGGSCLGGQLSPTVACGSNSSTTSYPLLLEIVDGGIVEISAGSSPASIASTTAIDGGALIRELVRGTGTRIVKWNAGQLDLAPSADYPGLFPFTESANNECVPSGEQLLCGFGATGAINAHGCVSASSGSPGSMDAMIVRLSAFDDCTVARRFNATNNGSAGARSLNGTDGPLVLLGTASAAVTFDNFVVSPPAHWFARLDASGTVTELATDPSLAMNDRSLPQSAVWGRTGLLVLGLGGTADPFFGRTFQRTSTFVATLDAADLARLERQWTLEDSDSTPRARIARVGDLIVVVMSGSELRLGNRLLAPDSQRRVHVLVFRE